MEMKHFSHEHLLSLIEVKVQLKKDSIKSLISICYGCLEYISREEFAYSCTQCEVRFFLHKSCAELPQEISHPKHNEHTLILRQRPLLEPQRSFSRCALCWNSFWGFTYCCSLCDFEVDIRCVLRDASLMSSITELSYLNHKSHQHPLIFKPRQALFFCTACGTEDKDQSYLCTKESCPFWIHKSCALLPRIMKESKHHDHPLDLAFSFPMEYRHMVSKCDFCGETIALGYWVYWCKLCKYFFHVRCANADTGEQIAQDGGEGEEKEPLGNYSIKLPGSDIFATSNIFAEMIRDFLKRYDIEQALSSEIEHFSHMHPLILSIGHQQDAKEKNYEEALICDGCILPINCDSYYSCAEKCSYFLHVSCAQLPKEFRHPSHLEHPLVLRKLERSFSYHECSFCFLICNGFLYSCTVCHFRLDLKCAILDTVAAIKHQAHPHQLVRKKDPLTSTYQCKSCGEYIGYFPLFGCKECSGERSFHLDYKCALLPGCITHLDYFRANKRDNHRLILMYPPFHEHPEEFYCEICEEEMHFRHWLYHCCECDRSFHSHCIVELYRYGNIKFGATLQVLHHRHALKFIIGGGFTPFCECCDGDLYCELAFACRDCNYYICYLCGINTQDGSSSYISSVDNKEMILAGNSDSVSEDKDEVQSSINLPMSDLESMVEHFLKQHGFLGSQLAEEIPDLNHRHALNLSTSYPGDAKKLKNEEIMICDACVRPISDPYYGCTECNYFLHACCTNLPAEIQLPRYQSHTLIHSKPSNCLYTCHFCHLLCNGAIVFESKERSHILHDSYSPTLRGREIILDIHCAILGASTLIKHQAHSHQLVPIIVGHKFRCNACGRRIYDYGLGCEDCGFYLDYKCALLPGVANHVKNHKHPLFLSCHTHTASQHSKEIDCESCDKKIYTIYWFYYCSECNQSFHPLCIPEFQDNNRNVNYGRLLRYLDHPHSLKLVIRSGAFRCNICGYRRDYIKAYACEPCGYYICMDCAERLRGRIVDQEDPRVADIVGSSSS